MTIRVIAVDDHAAVLIGIGRFLEREPDIAVVGTATGPSELLDLLGRMECDVLVTDFSMPDDTRSDGIQLLDRVVRQYPAMAVVVLTMIANASVLRTILDHGAIGVCDKGADNEDIVAAVRGAVRRQVFVSESFRNILDAEHRAPATGIKLSPREVEVVRLFGEGHSISTIAARLNRSQKTVSRQKRDAMVKLALENDDQLVDYARSKGFVSSV